MLDNDNRIFREQHSRFIAEPFQHDFIVRCIRGIEEDDIERALLTPFDFRAPSEKCRGVAAHYFPFFVSNTELIEIRFNQRAHSPRLIHERGVRRAAGQRFNSNRARSSAQIQKPRAFDSRRENIEQRLAQAIRSRPRLQRRWTLQSPSAIFSGDYAQSVLAPEPNL